MNTIFAQSSKLGKCGVSVFRISGIKSLLILRTLINDINSIFIPRKIYYKTIFHPKTYDVIDNVLVVYFKSPFSFTGDDVVEIYTHGSLAISSILTSVLLSISNVRLAEPGEFTKRAFLNGKIDLIAAEGIADLIESETILQHKQSIKQLRGQLNNLYSDWKNNLLTIISSLEAYIDFPDEGIPDYIITNILLIVNKLKDSINNHLNNKRGELLRSGIRLVIIGPANVGKSSLTNFLLQRDISIVSEFPGTTRDVIEGYLDIDGYPIILQDTAGIRSSNDVVELEGINRALSAAQISHIKIIMFDINWLLDTESFNKELNTFKYLVDDYTIILINKIDLLSNVNDIDNICLNYSFLKNRYLKVSLMNNLGLDLLISGIKDISNKLIGLTDEPLITRERQRHHIKEVLKYLTNFDISNDLVLATEDIRMAIRNLEYITGEVTINNILDRIFSNFCIGK